MPGEFIASGMWIVFPIIGIIMMALFMFVMRGRGAGPWSGFDDRDRRPPRDPSDAGETETPLSILKRRYAKGEISKEEYEEMKAEL